MEYFEEGDLQTKIDKGDLERNQIIKYFHQIVCAIKYIHDKNKVHGDLKPSNILCRGEKAVITDFGLQLTLSYSAMTVFVKGTHGYMAPECFTGAPTKSAKKCDIYSLGVVFYQMYEGKIPYGRGAKRGQKGGPSLVP